MCQKFSAVCVPVKTEGCYSADSITFGPIFCGRATC